MTNAVNLPISILAVIFVFPNGTKAEAIQLKNKQHICNTIISFIKIK